MMLLIYIIGAIVAMLIFAYIIYFVDRYLTLGHLALAVICTLGSWVSVVSVGIFMVDWEKKIWRKKE
jgi:hypothetical protein